MANELRDKLVELFAITSLEFEDAVVLANYLVCNGVTIPVRCKDCKQLMLWCKPTDKVIGECFIRKMNSEDEQFCMVGADDFCSYGERKTDG